jgi:pimeloyl-ACP methyl ester carboxylesterase
MDNLNRRELARLIALGAPALAIQGTAAAQGAAAGSRPWLTLPPTPSLPQSKRSETVSVNGASIFFAQFGNGPPVLLLHGGLGSSNYWGHQIAALAENFTVTVMDTRGHGRSPVVSGKFGFDLFADDVAALLKLLDIRSTAIVGWSDGAITGLQLAINRPEVVTRLFAFGANTVVGGLKPGGTRSPVFASYAVRCAGEYKKLSPHPERWPQLVSGLGTMWRTQPNFSKMQLASIKSPVLVSDGEYDEVIRHEHTEQIAEQIPNAKLLFLPKVSHFAMIQNPAQFNKALADFLRGNG